jgi:hypothetical protein
MFGGKDVNTHAHTHTHTHINTNTYTYTSLSEKKCCLACNPTQLSPTVSKY